MIIIHNQLTDIFPLSKEKFKIQIWIKKDYAKEVHLLYADRYDMQNLKIEGMEHEVTVYDYNVYSVIIKPKTKRLGYKFIIKDYNDKIFYYKQEGIATEDELYFGHFHFPYVNESDIFLKPEYVEDLIVYEIFPDRFYKSPNYSVNKEFEPWDYKKWDKKGSEVFLGGNLRGIIEKIDYFKELGINAIYLTPIYKSTTSHRYNVDDYYNVDPILGTNEDFKELVNVMHKNDIKVIIDMVFNHSGTNFYAFQDLIKNGEKSKYSEWYNVYSYPINTKQINYETFATNVREMPKLNTSNNEVQDFIINVLKYWINEFEVDGIRFDVANELDKNLLRRIRKEIKSINKEILLIGEVMHRSENFLLGDMFDGVMNYYSWEIFIKYLLGRKGAKETANNLSEYRLRINPLIFSCQLNLIGSHDTPRVYTLLGNKALTRLATVFNLTYQGIPMIYYGDEILMEGHQDPDCRRGMIWDKERWDNDILWLYKRLIKLKKNINALKSDNVKEGYINDVFYFKREANDEFVYVFINANKDSKLINLFDLRLIGKEIYYFSKQKTEYNPFANVSICVGGNDFEIIIASKNLNELLL